MSDLELREKVARLLGAKVIERKWCYWDYEGSWCHIPEGCEEMIPKDGVETSTERIMPCERKEGGIFYPLPHYETNIADAWEVVEFMRERGWDVSVHTPANHDPYAMLCGPEKRHDGLGGPYVAPTAPLAICKAFVAAMEGNHESR